MTLEEFLYREQPYSLRIGTKDGTGGFIYVGEYRTTLTKKLNRETRAHLRKKIREATDNLTAVNSIPILKNRIRDYEAWKPMTQRQVLDVAWSTIDDACIIIIEGCEAMVSYEPKTDAVIRFDNCLDALMFNMYLPVVKDLKIAYQQMRNEKLPDEKRMKATAKAAECERILLDDKYEYFKGSAPGLIRSIREMTREVDE